MSGDDGESIDEVWNLLDETRFYANAILNGASNEEGTFYPSRSPEVREKIKEVLAAVDGFVASAQGRYASLAGDQGVGSSADEKFDAIYDDLEQKIAAISAPLTNDAKAQALAGEARFSLAHGHLLVAEILGGDAGEEFAEALGSFENARKALEAHPDLQKSKDVLAQIGELIDLANVRHQAMLSTEKAGSGADVAFDETFERFIALADDAETLIHQEMDNGLSSLRSAAETSNALQVGGTLVLALLRQQPGSISAAPSATAHGSFQTMPTCWHPASLKSSDRPGGQQMSWASSATRWTSSRALWLNNASWQKKSTGSARSRQQTARS